MTIAQELLKKAVIGIEETLTSGSSTINSLEEFQTVVEEFDDMEDEGLLKITDKHHESQSGHRYVDIIKYIKI